MKYVLVLAVVLGLFWWLRRRSLRPPKSPAEAARAAPAQTEAKAETQAMLPCAHCGVHLPAAEAVRDAAGEAFCSAAHRLAGRR
jgi:uncharacterized protein